MYFNTDHVFNKLAIERMKSDMLKYYPSAVSLKSHACAHSDIFN